MNHMAGKEQSTRTRTQTSTAMLITSDHLEGSAHTNPSYKEVDKLMGDHK